MKIFQALKKHGLAPTLFWVAVAITTAFTLHEFSSTASSTIWGSSSAGELSSGRSVGNIANNFSSPVRLSGDADSASPALPQENPSGAQATAKRFIAVKHDLRAEASHEQLPKFYSDTLKLCAQLGCEVLSSEFSQGEPRSQYSRGQINARVAPAQIDKLISSLESNGVIKYHDIHNEDKTSQVIDVEARLANMTTLRDRLRLMLTEKAAKMSDVLEVERELARVQSELDSSKGMRAVLSKQTEMVEVQVQFSEKTAEAEWSDNGLSELPRVLKDSINTLHIVSLWLISMIVFLLPWAAVGLVLYDVCRRLWTLIQKWMPKSAASDNAANDK